MSEKRYFKIEYDEEWYLFDSTTISEQLVKEQAEYGYGVFANSLSPSEIVDLLNTMSNDIEEVEISIKLFEDDVQIKDKKIEEQQSTIQFLQDEIVELKKDIDIYKYEEKKHSKSARKLYEENEQLRRLFVEIKRPITIDLTEEDEKELRNLLGLIEDEQQ